MDRTWTGRGPDMDRFPAYSQGFCIYLLEKVSQAALEGPMSLRLVILYNFILPFNSK